MPADRIEQVRRVAQVLAAYDERAALSDVERAAILLAREALAMADEIERLRSPREDARSR